MMFRRRLAPTGLGDQSPIGQGPIPPGIFLAKRRRGTYKKAPLLKKGHAASSCTAIGVPACTVKVRLVARG